MQEHVCFSVLRSGGFGGLAVNRVCCGDALNGLGAVWPSPVMATFLMRRNPKGWLGTLNTCTTAFSNASEAFDLPTRSDKEHSFAVNSVLG
jgi:hypothetical protein